MHLEAIAVRPIHCILAALVLALGVTTSERIDSSKGLHDPNESTVWYDGRLLPLGGKGWEDTESYYDRLPAKAKERVRPPVWGLSHDTAGMCLHFATDAKTVKVRWTLRDTGLAMWG